MSSHASAVAPINAPFMAGSSAAVAALHGDGEETEVLPAPDDSPTPWMREAFEHEILMPADDVTDPVARPLLFDVTGLEIENAKLYEDLEDAVSDATFGKVDLGTAHEISCHHAFVAAAHRELARLNRVISGLRLVPVEASVCPSVPDLRVPDLRVQKTLLQGDTIALRALLTEASANGPHPEYTDSPVRLRRERQEYIAAALAAHRVVFSGTWGVFADRARTISDLHRAASAEAEVLRLRAQLRALDNVTERRVAEARAPTRDVAVQHGSGATYGVPIGVDENDGGAGEICTSPAAGSPRKQPLRDATNARNCSPMTSTE
jgi:hypothetical protein